MTADTIDISRLSSGQRVALMERLWRSLACELESHGPPAWHDAVLESREDEIAYVGAVLDARQDPAKILEREKVEQARRASD